MLCVVSTALFVIGSGTIFTGLGLVGSGAAVIPGAVCVGVGIAMVVVGMVGFCKIMPDDTRPAGVVRTRVSKTTQQEPRDQSNNLQTTIKENAIVSDLGQKKFTKIGDEATRCPEHGVLARQATLNGQSAPSELFFSSPPTSYEDVIRR